MQLVSLARLRYLLLALVVAIPGLLSATADLATAADTATGIIGKVRWAYYVPYAANSLDSLKQHVGSLSHLSPYWYTLDGEGNVLTTGSEVNEANKEIVLQLARGRAVKVLPMLKNSATYADFTPVLARPELRKKVIDQLLVLVVANKFDGIHIDFEGISAEDRPHLTAFMANLAPVMRGAGKLVTQAVPAREQERTTGWAGAYDYAALAPYNDLIVVMTYGYGVGVPQSTSPFPWVERSISYAASQMSPQKVLLGLAWYGYDWNVSGGSAAPVRHVEAMTRAKTYNATVEYDDIVQTPHFSYTADEQQHEVWFEDRRSNDAKMDLVFKYGLAGAAGWRMGHEDGGVWTSYKDRLGFQTWYLAEGATTPPYDTWVLIQNPNPYPVTTTVTFLKEDGANVMVRQDINAGTRFSIYANVVVPNAAFSTKVEASAPVFVERAMYFGYDGHDSIGVNAPSRRWYLPEGSAKAGTHTWVLLMNPSTQPVQARVTFLREVGPPIQREFQLKPTSRLNIFANQHVPDGFFSTIVEADVPIVAERASYTDGGKAGYGSLGSTLLSQRWYMAEGFTSYQTQVAIINPGKVQAKATMTLFFENGSTQQSTLMLPPSSRITHLPPQYSPGEGYSTMVEADQPVAVERTSFVPNGGVQGGLGVTAPAKTWYLAEGSTAAPFQTFLLLQNPNSVSVKATVTFMREAGNQVVMEFQLKPRSRFTIPVNHMVPNTAVSMQVDSDLPLVVERTMYFGRGAHASAGIPQ